MSFNTRGYLALTLSSILVLWILTSTATNSTRDDIKSLLPCVKDCEALADRYLRERYEVEASSWKTRTTLAEWAYLTDLGNDTARDETQKVELLQAAWKKLEHKEYISQFKWTEFTDESIKRQFKSISQLGIAALSESDVAEYTSILMNMTKTYSTAKICPYGKQVCDLKSEGLSLNPDIDNILSQSSDYNELSYAWEAWRNASGKPIRGLFNNSIDLLNKAAQANGYRDGGDVWVSEYETDNFRKDMEVLYTEVVPLYEELHAYVRFRLSQVYPEVNTSNPIPAHVLGNMWSQTWENVYKHVVPFPNSPSLDATPELKKRFPGSESGVREMFKVANEFFLSLGLEDMSDAFGDKAQIVKPTDGRQVDCHPFSVDFGDGKDFRVRMCTNVQESDFIIIHHELGHIQYCKQYKDLPFTFRDGANPGFHEAIGDVVALSVSSASHMRLLGYVNSSLEVSEESEMNFLLRKSLERVAWLPFGYLMDKFRWGLFDGSIPRDQMTKHWLRLRNSLQGLVPPVSRSESDFDAGSKFHIAANVPYIRYFVAFILQFQIQKELCITAGHKGPLHTCDIYGSKEAGLKFKKLMAAGSSRHWEEILGDLTDGRSTKLSAEPIKEYFKPLTEFLKDQRHKLNYPIGWNPNAYINFYKEP